MDAAPTEPTQRGPAGGARPAAAPRRGRRRRLRRAVRRAQSLGIDPEVRVTLVDRRNFHLFQPLLYQVATGALSPGDIAQPLRSILRKQRNTTVILGEAIGIDADRREVLLADGGPIAYDTLIVATGAHHTYFDHPEWAPFAPGLKTIEDATEIRRRILIAFEAAEREADPERRREWMTFVLVGGGPTGVELAGALGEIAHDTLKRDFRSIRPGRGADRPGRGDGPDPAALSARSLGLGAAPARAARRRRSGRRRGSSTSTSGRSGSSVRRTARRSIPTRTVLWAAGVSASTFARTVATATGAETDRAGRVHRRSRT